MEKIQQIVPISQLRTAQDEILAMMDEAPVVLAQRSKLRAVLVSVTEWGATAVQMQTMKRRLARLEGYLEAKRNLEQMKADPASTTTGKSLVRQCTQPFHFSHQFLKFKRFVEIPIGASGNGLCNDGFGV